MKFAVVGAGLVGLYMGGSLLKGGHEVHFYGRQRYGELVNTHGLTVSTLANETFHAPAGTLRYSTDTSTLDRDEFDMVLVTLKSVQTPEAVELLAKCKQELVIVSFQNGVRNAEQLRAGLPNQTVLAGMFPFNVVLVDTCHLHQATSGVLYVEETPHGVALAEALTQVGVPTSTSTDMRGILFGKLFLNLHNAFSALTGLPTKIELGTYELRQLLAQCQEEAVVVFAAAGITAISPTIVPLWLLVHVMRVPNWLFGVLAASQLRIDETAFSSMYDDLKNGRITEIDQLQGEIVALGQQHGVPTPYNRAVLQLVKEAEQAKAGSPKLSVSDLQQKIQAALHHSSTTTATAT